MKHLFLALMLTIGFDTSAQVDGMFAFSLDSSQDTVYSMYNASPDIRDELKDHLFAQLFESPTDPTAQLLPFLLGQNQAI